MAMGSSNGKQMAASLASIQAQLDGRLALIEAITTTNGTLAEVAAEAQADKALAEQFLENV